ncbi:hypothetical protein GGI35DRAFT_79366 [Trichoderma velutinum]
MRLRPSTSYSRPTFGPWPLSVQLIPKQPQAPPPPAQFGSRPGAKTPQSCLRYGGSPAVQPTSTSPSPAGLQRCSPAGSSTQRARCASALGTHHRPLQLRNGHGRTSLEILTELNSTTKQRRPSDSLLLRLSFLFPLSFFLLGLDFPPDRRLPWPAAALHRCQRKGASRTGANGSFAVIAAIAPASSSRAAAARMPRCCAPSTQLAILGPDPQSAVSPPACSWSAHHSTPMVGAAKRMGNG